VGFVMDKVALELVFLPFSPVFYLPGSKEGPARKADNLTAICGSIV
jgi:hypothetical protein